MELTFSDHVDILGTAYSILVKNKDEHACFKGHADAFGCTELFQKVIIIRDLLALDDLTEEDRTYIFLGMQKTLRHEIVHAFLHESGLDRNSTAAGRWAKNEEMVDWMALQGPKLMKAWEQAGAL